MTLARSRNTDTSTPKRQRLELNLFEHVDIQIWMVHPFELRILDKGGDCFGGH